MVFVNSVFNRLFQWLRPCMQIFFEKGGQTLYENIKNGYDLVFFENNFFILLLHFTFFLLSIHKKVTYEQYSGTYEYRKDFR